MPESTTKVFNYLNTTENNFTDAMFNKKSHYKVAEKVEPLFNRIQNENK